MCGGFDEQIVGEIFAVCRDFQVIIKIGYEGIVIIVEGMNGWGIMCYIGKKRRSLLNLLAITKLQFKIVPKN